MTDTRILDVASRFIELRRMFRCVALLVSVAVLPSAAHAQASLAGVVRDTSGAVLPGVTVEATSDVLIERVRTAVTDGTGQYRLTELPPGSYAVTFSLAGFNTIQRQGVVVSGVGVITINADLQVGALQRADVGHAGQRQRHEQQADDEDGVEETLDDE